MSVHADAVRRREMTSDGQRITTALGLAQADRVLVRGRDLTAELVGSISFTDMASLVLRGSLPSTEERRMLDALLVILVEHGMVPQVVAARLVYHSAPEALQGAVAAALLGAGSRHLGSSEWAARMLQEATASETTGDSLDPAAEDVVERFAARKQPIPGLGHRTHGRGDPRAERLFQVARETGTYGTHCQLIQRIATIAGERRGRPLPVNVTGAIAAITSDMGFRWEMAKAFALIGRTLGALGHIQEELENPMAERIRDLVAGNLEYEMPDGRVVTAEGTA